jgi:apolipoprotein N-acyltransferase
MINITNDSWSHSATSHWQHAAMSVFRAIENRIWVVRVGNSGVSCLISPQGRIEKALGPFQQGILVGEISRRQGSIGYTNWGDLFAGGCLVFSFCLTSLLGYDIFRKRQGKS